MAAANGKSGRDTVPLARSDAEPVFAMFASPVIDVAARLVTGAATEITPSASMVVLAPCLTPPSTLAVATGRL
ncbi:MAG: hypothetical protein EBR82_83250 [Caulobacteraceae bacterium]|nr:hypothetical protein [Caulobacteraceae bacterium]